MSENCYCYTGTNIESDVIWSDPKRYKYVVFKNTKDISCKDKA